MVLVILKEVYSFMEELNSFLPLLGFFAGFQVNTPPQPSVHITHATNWLTKAERLYGMNSPKLVPFLYELSQRLIDYGPNNYKGALPLLERAYEIQSGKTNKDEPGSAEAMAKLGECVLFAGETGRAEDLLKLSVSMMEEIPGVQDHFKGLGYAAMAFLETAKANPGTNPVMLKLQLSANPAPLNSLPPGAQDSAAKALDIYNAVQSRKYADSTFQTVNSFNYEAMARAFNLEETMKGSFSDAVKGLKNSPAGSAGREGCFIATQVYGSYDCFEVKTLRKFRDEKLKKSFAGKVFIDIYYKTGPYIAILISRSPIISNLFRSVLDRFIRRRPEK